MSSGTPVTVLTSVPLAVLDAYRTCEFVTLGRDGAPLAWPAAVLRRDDGTLLLTTSLVFAQKARNVRRDGRVALLFSDPTGSGLSDPPQIFVSGHAHCPDTVMTGPEGAEAYWQMLFERQPRSRLYLSPLMRPLTSWYFLRLHITVTPEQVTVRPPLPAGPSPVSGTEPLLGAAHLARHPTAVLAARDADGAPLLARVRPRPTPTGYTFDLPPDVPAVPGPAGLLVHRHDEQLDNMTNALLRGALHRSETGWTLTATRLVEPMPATRPAEVLRFLHHARTTTARCLDRRGLRHLRVQWSAFRTLSEQTRTPIRPDDW